MEESVIDSKENDISSYHDVENINKNIIVSVISFRDGYDKCLVRYRSTVSLMDSSNGVLFVGESVTDSLFALGEYAVLVVVGLLGFLLIVARFELLHAATGGESARESKRNCPSCGARTTVEPAACDYCGELIDR